MRPAKEFYALAALGHLVAVLILSAIYSPAAAQERYIVLQSTTSTQNSGLFDHLLPLFFAETGIEVRVVAVGTGQALRNAANGDGDVVLVHAKEAEEAFVRSGDGLSRADLMYNDFVLVGPPADPAGIRGETDVLKALRRIADQQAVFVSRGDDSGTNRAELRLWAAIDIDTAAVSGTWYRETGSGMGATLNIGSALSGYVMTDRASWISFGNKGDHVVIFEGDPRLLNQYGIILVNPARHPGVKADIGEQFVRWMLSSTGQNAIAGHRVNGQQLFYPNALQ